MRSRPGKGGHERMDAEVVFEISEAMERQLCMTDRTWWREVIDPLQDELASLPGSATRLPKL